MLTIDDLWRIMRYLKDGTTDPNLSELTTTLATSEKETITKYFEQIIDQDTFSTDDMQRLRAMLIDWYTSHRTIATTQRYLSDVHQIPNNQLSELFRSFGFPHGLNLVPLTTKANFFLDLVNFYKKKGTPETLVDVLDYYGFSDTDLIEYWLQKDQYGNLVFRGESVRLAATGSTILLDTDVPFEKLTDPDPHWLQSKSNIESLITTNKIGLPSKSPYYSLSSIFSLYNITISLSILFRIVEDQYDRFMLSQELPYNTPVKNLGEILPILHIYVATCYAFQKMFGPGAITTFTNYNCYNGVVEYLGDPPVPHNLSNLTEVYENLIKSPISRDDRTTRIQSIVDDWSRPMSQNFLNSLYASESLLDALNPDFKTNIDTWFDTGDESYLITYLIGTLDNWIRLNIDSKSPSLVITMLGLGFRKELYEILNFFKPYRARLAFMDTAFSFKNPLTESVILDELLITEIGSFYRDSIRPASYPCNQTQAEIDLETLMEMTWKWDTGQFFDSPPIIPNIPGAKDPFPPALCNNLEWLYDIGRRYDIPMPPEYLNFSYDSGGYYDIIPILQKCIMEALKHHPGGGICDSFMMEIGLFFHDKIGRTNQFNQNWDTGASFDSGVEETWYDRADIINNVIPPGDHIEIDDDGVNNQVGQLIHDTFGEEWPTQMDVGQSFDTMQPKPAVRDSFIIVITSNARATITTSVGKYPSSYDTGNTFDSLTNLDVVSDGRIFKWLSSNIPIQSFSYASILDIGIIEEMTADVVVVSSSSADMFFGIPVDLTSNISITSSIVSEAYVGAAKETLTSTVVAESNIFNTELTIGEETELSSNVSITTNIDSLLTTGIIKILSSVVVSIVDSASELLSTGAEEALSSSSDITSNTNSDLIVVNSLYVARSIIIDIENNHGDPINMALMGIRFSNFGNIVNIGVPGVDYDAYATSTLEPDPYSAWRLFYNTSPLTGTASNWMANNQTTRQRIICTIGAGIYLDEILFYNYHASGTDTDKGINEVKVYLSPDIVTGDDFEDPISNSELVYDGIIDEHSNIDEEDPQSITIGVYAGSSNSITNVTGTVSGAYEMLSSTLGITTNVNNNIDMDIGDSEVLSGTSNVSIECYSNVDIPYSGSSDSTTDSYSAELIFGMVDLTSSIGINTDVNNANIEVVIILASMSNFSISIADSILGIELDVAMTSISNAISIVDSDLGFDIDTSGTINVISSIDSDLGLEHDITSTSNAVSSVDSSLDTGDNEELTGSSTSTSSVDSNIDVGLSGTSNTVSSVDSSLDTGDNEIISGTSTSSTFAFTTILTTGITEVLTSTSTTTSEFDSDLTIV